jgi:hybrid cluster-associated redox disulfide protein
MAKINKKMKFSEIIKKNPEAIQILLDKGMHCIGCGMAGFETLEDGAIAHGIDPDKVVEEINKKSEKKSIKKKDKTKKGKR